MVAPSSRVNVPRVRDSAEKEDRTVGANRASETKRLWPNGFVRQLQGRLTYRSLSAPPPYIGEPRRGSRRAYTYTLPPILVHVYSGASCIAVTRTRRAREPSEGARSYGRASERSRDRHTVPSRESEPDDEGLDYSQIAPLLLLL